MRNDQGFMIPCLMENGNTAFNCGDGFHKVENHGPAKIFDASRPRIIGYSYKKDQGRNCFFARANVRGMVLLRKFFIVI